MKSIEERITENVLETLETVRVVGGYSSDFQVERADRMGNTVKNSTVILEDGDIQLQSDSPLGRDVYEKSYTLLIPALLTDTNTEADGARRAKYKADAIKALTNDQTYQRGGLAHNTTFTSSTQLAGDGFAGERIEFTVRFWTDRHDPYNQ